MTPIRLYVFGALVSITVAVLANILAPGALSTAAATFAILVPLATILIIDRLTALRETYDLKEEVLSAVRDAGVKAGQVVSLGSGDAWVRYIERNAAGAKAILNTRLSEFGGVYAEYHERVDDAIAEAIRSGTDYYFVCAQSRLGSLEKLKDRLRAGVVSDETGLRHLHEYVLDTAGKPLLQMKIFDYGEYSEAMLGFVARSESDREQPIFLVQSQDLVAYLKHVFLSYCDEAVSRGVHASVPESPTAGPATSSL